MSTKVLIKNNQKTIKIPSGIKILVRRSCNAVLTLEGFKEPAEVSVTFVNNEEISKINGEFRGKLVETDVLSFPLGVDGKYDKDQATGSLILGDIVISVEKALQQSETYGHSLQREIAFLTVHSMYHLIGYNHEEGGLAAVKMREKEEEALTKLGLQRTMSYGV